jgi:SAM-dependent methyltransferase
MAGRAPHFDAERMRRLRQRWRGTSEALLGPATELMLDEAALKAGMRVLDVAAGAGDQTTRAAARVGRNGTVVATDVAAEVLRFAATEARDSGIVNIEFRPMPCEQLGEFDTEFDGVISRNGLQYVSDLAKGLAEIRRVLKPGARLAAVVWASAARNGFLAPSFAIARRTLHLTPPEPEDPDAFKLGEDGAFRTALESAGFRDVRITSVDASAAFGSASEALLFQQEAVGELVRLLAGGTDLERVAAWREIEAALGVFATDQGFIGPAALLVGSAMK